MRAASQLPGKGPTGVVDAPATARQKSDYDMRMYFCSHMFVNKACINI